MIKMASWINEEATVLARQMAETGEKLLPLSFGSGDSMFITSDTNLIRAIHAVEVDGVVYLVGFKK